MAHPPCAQWGRMKGLARRNELEAWLGPFCFEQVRLNGGVLEHPAYSSLWGYVGVKPFVVSARWFGFAAEKLTGVWIAGGELPRCPMSMDAPTKIVAHGRRLGVPYMERDERQATPVVMAKWLLEAARGTVST